MNQPCATAVGNALEVMEVMQALSGAEIDNVLCDLTADLGGEVLVLAGMADDATEGAKQITETLRDGSAAERFGRMVTELGGPADFVDRWRDRLPAAPVVAEVKAGRAGYVTGMDGEAIGLAVVRLGGGRLKGGERIDPSVGLSDVAILGDRLEPDTPLCLVHAATPEAAEEAAAAVRAAYTIAEQVPDVPPVVYRRVG
jgi:thymidine phosphorylase